MSSALGGLTDSLRRNSFCIGVKRGSGYRCGGETDENAINKAVELLGEAVERILRWRVWDIWWVEEHADEWLKTRDKLEMQLRDKYSEEVINAVTGLVDKFISYNELFLNYWRSVGDEVRRLVNDLMSGRAEVIIRGKDTSSISVYYEHITLEVDRASNDSVMVQLKLSGLEGVAIEVPDVFRRTMSGEEYGKFVEEVLKALRGGFEETDGRIEKGNKVAMDTTQIWQAIVWSLLYPGKMRVYIDAVNLNENSMTIRWRLRSSHDSLKGKILSNIDKLSEEGLLSFMLTAVLGDGYADVVKPIINGRAYGEAVIKIAMSGEEFERWEPLFERLESMGFRSGKPNLINGNEVEVPFYGSNAIDLARTIISILPPILRDIMDALSFEKWLNLRRISEMELKFRRGEMQVNVAGYGFTVKARDDTVVLEHKAKNDAEAEEVIETLKAKYGDEFAKYVRINKNGKYLAVIIPMYVFEKYSDIKEQVIEVLCRKLEKTKDERRRQIITKHLRRLAPTKEVAAADCSQEFST